MTLTKKALGEVLARIDDQWEDGADVVTATTAARFTERLLLGECYCEGGAIDHKPCHGTGQLWDEGLVEAVRHAIDRNASSLNLEDLARAVLSALAGEVGK